MGFLNGMYFLSLFIVQHHGTQTHLGLGFWLSSMAHGPNLFLPKTLAQTHTSYGPKFCIAQKPKEWTINISTHLVSPLGPCSANHSRAIRKTFGYTIPCIPGSALGNIAAKHIYRSGNQFQSHSHHTPLPPKHPLTIDDIGPPIALTLKAIIIPPLTVGYKYEKLTQCLVRVNLGGMENIGRKMLRKTVFSNVWQVKENRKGGKPRRKFSLWAHKFHPLKSGGKA